MRITLLKTAIGLTAFLLFTACAAKTNPVTNPNEAAGGEAAASQSPYYYYTESQINKKKGNFDRAVWLLKQAVVLDPDSVYLMKELADLYLHQKNNQGALTVVEGILAKHPDDIDALITYGKIKQSLRQMDDAKAAYRRVIEKDPELQNIYLLLGGIYMQENDLAAALPIYQKLVKMFPDSYVGHFFIGKIEAQLGHPETAEKELLKTLDLNSNLEEPRFELIKLYAAQGKDAEVVRMYEDILSISPNHIRAAMGLGYTYYRQGKKAAAESIFISLGSRSLSDTNVVRHLVQEFIDEKRYDAAIVILAGMLKGAPDSSDLNYIAGVANDGKGEKQQAIAFFEKVSSGSRFYQSAMVQIAFLYQDLGDTPKGIERLTALIREFPQKADLYIYLGSFYEESEALDKSAEAFEKGIALEPDNAKAYFRLGVVYDKRGDKTASIAAMRKVIELDPENANALNYLGYTYADLGQNLKEAEDLIRKALQLKPDDGYITDSLGWVFFKQGYYEAALKHLQEAARIVPEDPVILEHLGDVYLKINEKEKALEYYRRSLIKQKKEKERDLLKKKIEALTGEKF